MQQIAGENCYTTAELVKAMGSDYTPKRIEYLRTLGLLPAPVKVGSRTGTVGYHTERVLNHLKAIEKEHQKGRSYPDMVMQFGGQTLIIEAKMSAIRKGRAAQRQVIKYMAESLNPVSQVGPAIKLSMGAKGKIKVSVFDEINTLEEVLKELFKRKDKLSSEVLGLIEINAKRLQELRELKNAYIQVGKKLPFLTKKDFK